MSTQAYPTPPKARAADTARHAFITAAGAYLPGEPVSNEQIEQRLGCVAGKPSRFRRRILKANGIESRHYALDAEGRQTHLNEELAAHAVTRALAARGVGLERVGMLALGTVLGDMLMPGFSVMVHGRLGGRPMECLSAGGVCASGIAALRAAVNAVRVGDHDLAVAGGSEAPSWMLRSSRFDRESELAPERPDAAGSFQYFNADFLRWMLSDGAGAAVVERAPRPDGLSLRVDWVELTSYANEHETCMYLGLSDPRAPRVGATMSSHSSFADAERAGLMIIHQDTTLLGKHIVDVVCRDAARLRDAGRIDPTRVDWFMPHLSSYYFYDALRDGLARYGVPLPHDKWFTNLRTKGNTGSASFYIMLEEGLSSGLFKPGQRILAMVPESARFSVAYAHFTVVAA